MKLWCTESNCCSYQTSLTAKVFCCSCCSAATSPSGAIHTQPALASPLFPGTRQSCLRRRLFFVRDAAGKAALRPSLATMEALVRNHQNPHAFTRFDASACLAACSINAFVACLHVSRYLWLFHVISCQELALSHLKGEYRTLLLDQAPMLNVRPPPHCCSSPKHAARIDCISIRFLLATSIALLTSHQKLALAHRRGSAFALAIELIELGLL